jgi:hypothetical protein
MGQQLLASLRKIEVSNQKSEPCPLFKIVLTTSVPNIKSIEPKMASQIVTSGEKVSGVKICEFSLSNVRPP